MHSRAEQSRADVIVFNRLITIICMCVKQGISSNLDS
jgi:hypothetical protein